jgi:hypothetical protein
MKLELNDFEEKVLYIAISDAIGFEIDFQDQLTREADREIPLIESKQRLSALYSLKGRF